MAKKDEKDNGQDEHRLIAERRKEMDAAFYRRLRQRYEIDIETANGSLQKPASGPKP